MVQLRHRGLNAARFLRPTGASPFSTRLTVFAEALAGLATA
jgi:hypothetical protein